MRREIRSSRVTWLILGLCLAVSPTLIAADRLLPIPRWFPAEPGQKLEYRLTQSHAPKAGTLTVEIREVTHGDSSYSASAHLTMREPSGIGEELEVEFSYANNTLTATVAGHDLVIGNVLPNGKAGDVLEIMSWNPDHKVAAKVISVSTKVAINETRWDNALVVTGESDEGDNHAVFKATFAAPEGLIRGTGTNGAFHGTLELVPPRKPFDK